MIERLNEHSANIFGGIIALSTPSPESASSSFIDIYIDSLIEIRHLYQLSEALGIALLNFAERLPLREIHARSSAMY